MEQPWTHELLSYDSSFLNYSLVSAIQQRWVTPKHEMFSYDLCSLNYSVVRAVRLDGATLNSWNIVLLSPFLNYLGSSSSSTGLKYTLNLWNVLLRSFIPQLNGSSSSSAWFIKLTRMGHYVSDSLNYKVLPAVRLGCSTPNSGKSLLRCLIFILLSRLRSSAWFH